ncbi:MAG: hypothetical protein JW920_00050, partial [Deltaproteobacteria bacterium]|nr:hypothetical protein [Deltaproteobacteria bacterium]
VLFGFIWLHLILHWDWEKFNIARYLKIGPRTLIVVVVFLLVIFAFIVPSCLTDEFPSRKDFKQTYPKTATHAMKT